MTVMTQSLKQLETTILPYQTALSAHPLYAKLQTLADIEYFMSVHVYSVWDFMNLLKTLQQTFTCVQVPWQPSPSATMARLINEIVLEEESDIIDGQATSHFSYYVNALKAIETKPSSIHSFLEDLAQNTSYLNLITAPYVPETAKPFLKFTYDCIQKGPVSVAAAFTFGRETLIPTMFQGLMAHSGLSKNATIRQFVAYLDRHIDLDQEHGKLATDLLKALCKTEADWKEAQDTAVAALKARIQLWDDVLTKLG